MSQEDQSDSVSAEPSSQPAWQLEYRRAVVLLEQGQLQPAEAAFHEALRLNPDSLEVRLGLAAVLTQAGRGHEAVPHYEQVLARKPDSFGALHDFGVTLRLLNRPSDAIVYLRRAIEINPSAAEAHHSLALALEQTEHRHQAEAAWKRALELQPNYADARKHLAKYYLEQARFSEAVENYQLLLSLWPANEAALNELGISLCRLRRSAEAAVYLRQAIRLNPHAVASHANLALALTDLGRWKEAEAEHRLVVGADPTDVRAHVNLANCRMYQGRVSEAIAGLDLAIFKKPDDVSAHLNGALAKLLAGDYQAGFREHEWRWRRNDVPPPRYASPVWDGSNLSGKTILLWPEQGLGDSIQFIRYASMVKARGAARVICECDEVLAELFASCAGIDVVVPRKSATEVQPAFDAHASIMSLPAILGTTLKTVPQNVPYLIAAPEAVQRWREKLAPVTEMRIGIAWQGNPTQPADHHRSLPFKHFNVLAGLKGVRFFSLQRGFGAEQVTKCERKGALRSISMPLDPSFHHDPSMAESAALVMNLDLVVTVDSAIAHLVGALGKPVWVLLSAVADWRYLQDRSDSPWYPTMRLFRQRRLDQWRPVLKKVLRELHELNADSVADRSIAPACESSAAETADG